MTAAFLPAILFGLGLDAGEVGGGVLPDPGDVRLGVSYDLAHLPAAGDVRAGIVYG